MYDLNWTKHRPKTMPSGVKTTMADSLRNGKLLAYCHVPREAGYRVFFTGDELPGGEPVDISREWALTTETHIEWFADVSQFAWVREWELYDLGKGRTTFPPQLWGGKIIETLGVSHVDQQPGPYGRLRRRWVLLHCARGSRIDGYGLYVDVSAKDFAVDPRSIKVGRASRQPDPNFRARGSALLEASERRQQLAEQFAPFCKP